MPPRSKLADTVARCDAWREMLAAAKPKARPESDPAETTDSLAASLRQRALRAASTAMSAAEQSGKVQDLESALRVTKLALEIGERSGTKPEGAAGVLVIESAVEDPDDERSRAEDAGAPVH